MVVIYQSKKFDPSKVVSVYARLYTNGEVKAFEVDDKNKKIREWAATLGEVEFADKLVEKAAGGFDFVLVSGPGLVWRKLR